MVRRRKSWVSSVGSGDGGWSGWDGGREGEGGGEVIVAWEVVVILGLWVVGSRLGHVSMIFGWAGFSKGVGRTTLLWRSEEQEMKNS